MLTSVVNKWPKWAKILLTIFGGASVVYRAFIFVDDCIAKKDNQNYVALIIAILGAILWPFTIVLMVKDIIDLAHDKEISWLTNPDLFDSKEAPKAEEPKSEEPKAEDAQVEKVEAEVVE